MPVRSAVVRINRRQRGPSGRTVSPHPLKELVEHVPDNFLNSGPSWPLSGCR
ncbi:protein of unknown function [Streptomyces sp. KY75]|nr:protein of unknown function [Streptomyces sp. KY75]